MSWSVDGLGSCRGRAALIATGERSSTLHRREGIEKKKKKRVLLASDIQFFRRPAPFSHN